MDCKVRGQRERKYEISIIVVVSVDDCAVLKIITRHPQSKSIVAKIGDLSWPISCLLNFCPICWTLICCQTAGRSAWSGEMSSHSPDCGCVLLRQGLEIDYRVYTFLFLLFIILVQRVNQNTMATKGVILQLPW